MENWFKIEFICTHKLHISPLHLRELEFYEIEYLLKNFEEYIDEEEKQHKKQEKTQASQQSSYQQPKMPKAGNDYGGFKTPKIDIPKISVPKF